MKNITALTVLLLLLLCDAGTAQTATGDCTVDLAGRTVKDAVIDSDEVDISDLHSGMFIATLLREGKPMFTSKLVVNRID